MTMPIEEGAKRSQRRPIAVLVVLAALIVLGGLWLAFRDPADQLQGMVDADEVKVAAKIAARVAALHVDEGDRVAPGQLLLTLDSPEVAAKEQQAMGALQAAQAIDDKAREGARAEDIAAAAAQWRRAQAAADLAQTTHQRTENLYRDGVIARQRRDEAMANATAALEAARAARALYDQALAGARIQDQTAAAGQLHQAEGALAEVAAARRETQVLAPIGGEIGERMADIGELVPAGYPVYTILDIDRLWIAVTLREDQFHGLKMGAVLRGDVPALAIEQASFSVYHIAPAGEYATWRASRQSAGYDIKSFEVRLRPTEPIDGLRPGMSVLFHWPQ